MIDPDDVATWRFHRMSPAAVVTSGLMHAAVAMALLPGFLPVHARLTERAIEVTLDLPATPPTELSASSAAIVQQAAHNTDPGSGALEQSAPERGEQHTLAAPPQPSEPDLASVLPSSEPPPPVEAREFATSSPAAAPVTEAERILPPLEAPPPLTGRDFAMTAPSSVPQTQAAQRQAQTPAPAHPVQRAKPTRASRQQPLPEGSLRANRQPDRPLDTAAADHSTRKAQQDYLWQVVRKLSQYRFYPQSREDSEQGIVITRLTVGRDGRVLGVSLARSSGFPGLDRAVMDTIRRASPFAPLPADIAQERYTFIVPISYMHER